MSRPVSVTDRQAELAHCCYALLPAVTAMVWLVARVIQCFCCSLVQIKLCTDLLS